MRKTVYSSVVLTTAALILSLWVGAGHAFLVDVRNYIAKDTVGFRMCANATFCLDGQTVVDGASKEFIRAVDNGIRVYSNRDNGPPYLFGAHKDIPGAGQVPRCFANVGMNCGGGDLADYAPGAVPLIMDLPVLSGASIKNDRKTPGATLIPEYAVWRSFQTRQFNAANCSQGPPLGTAWQKVYAFVADSVCFGGTVGCQPNILVIEGDSSSCDPGTLHGRRLERYYYSSTYSELRETGMEDTGCNPECSGGCDGIYNVLENDSFFPIQTSGDWNQQAICPYVGGAW